MSAFARSRTAKVSTVSLTALAALGATTALTVPAHAQPGGGKAVERVNGADRYGTAEKASQSLWPDAANPGGKLVANAVVLAKGDDFPDALGGIPLAAAKQGPLLVTPGARMDPAVLTEIQRVLPRGKTVYVLGGVKALTPAVDVALQGAGYVVQRIAGVDRYDTSLQIANVLGNPQRVIVATGTDFADALAAGPLASIGGPGSPGAILLSNAKTLSPSIAAYVRGVENGPQDLSHNVFAVGGAAKTAVGLLGSSNYQAEAGTDRYDTACLVAYAYTRQGRMHDPQKGLQLGQAPVSVGVATGGKFPDALGGGAAIAQVPGPLLLASPTAGLTACETNFVVGVAPQLNWVEIYGGTAVVSPAVEQQLHTLVGF